MRFSFLVQGSFCSTLPLLLLLASSNFCGCLSFGVGPKTTTSVRSRSSSSFNPVLYAENDSMEESLRQEAAALLEQAKAIRSQLPADDQPANLTTSTLPFRQTSPWSIPEDKPQEGVDYRLYVDIGREEGSWMDPRWGASGRRIAFSMDVRLSKIPAHTHCNQQKMVSDNVSGKSSPVYELYSGKARLNKGFDEMISRDGAYRIDASRGRNKADTVRFFVKVDGTPQSDVYVPPGNLYFSLPTFRGLTLLSTKEGVVSIRQYGWHTGWRRLESRIVGVFRAVKLEDAKLRDGY